MLGPTILNRKTLPNNLAVIIISILISWLIAVSISMHQDAIGALANMYFPVIIGILSLLIFTISYFAFETKKSRLVMLTFCVFTNLITGISLRLSFETAAIQESNFITRQDETKASKFVSLNSDQTHEKGIEVYSTDNIFENNRLVFSYAFSPNNATKLNKSIQHHLTAVLHIKNVRNHQITINAADFSHPELFSLTENKRLVPIKLMPGDSTELTVKFNPELINKRVESHWYKLLLKLQYKLVSLSRVLNYQYPFGSTYTLHNGKLTLTTDDVMHPSEVINMTGLWEYKTENDWEPDLKTIMTVFNLKTNIGFKNFDGGINGDYVTTDTDEIIADYFTVADQNKPILVKKLAAYHGCCAIEDADTLELFFPKLDVIQPLHKTGNNTGQMLLPEVQDIEPYLANDRLSQPFALKIGSAFTARNKNYKNKIGIRIWKVVDENNKIIKDAYILGSDYLGKKGTNYDYQDNVYLIANIKPLHTDAELLIVQR